MAKNFKTARLILGDQLNRKHSWFKSDSNDVLYVLMEIKPESEYVTHHIQKIVGIFQAMRTFSEQLDEGGHAVKYFKINDEDNQHSFVENLKVLYDKYQFDRLEYQEPDEYRLDSLLGDHLSKLSCDVSICSTEHFLTNRNDVKEMFEGKRSFLMETFYRKMRTQYGILMDGDDPAGGKWNYDHENRKKLPKDHTPPEPHVFDYDVSAIVEEIKHAGLESIGEIDAEHFIWPKNREDALDVLEYFFKHLFKNFGKYQDALTDSSWSVYHSRISFGLNLKMIHPLEVIQKAEQYWKEHQDEINLSQVEGFIRQILGWREYMRGIYWAHMPEYASLNYFGLDQELPDWYWTGNTKMNCLSKAIRQSLEHSYAHHIQRLMVTGNFALLAGIDPDEVDQWYLGIYIDAFEWVEITNTRGMSQFADGGIVGTKPYVSSASYVNKMGDHCKNCHYNHKEKFGEQACPFNTLYWNFIDQQKDKLESNPRMSMMYRLWDKMDDEQKEKILIKASEVLDQLNDL